MRLPAQWNSGFGGKKPTNPTNSPAGLAECRQWFLGADWLAGGFTAGQNGSVEKSADLTTVLPSGRPGELGIYASACQLPAYSAVNGTFIEDNQTDVERNRGDT